MRLPDERALLNGEGVVPDPAAESGRVVFWLRGERAGGFQYWERVSSAPGAEVGVARGVCFVAVTGAPARQAVRTAVSRLIGRLLLPGRDQDYVLPDGSLAERHGPRRTDVALAWPEHVDAVLDEAVLRARWPECRAVRPVGKDLYLVYGVTAAPLPEVVAPAADLPAADGPRAAAERALTAARATGDRNRVLTALTDLGLSYLQEGDVPRAETVLTEALAGARERHDRPREADALHSLALAALLKNQADVAQQYLGLVLAYAREAADPYVEKLALERLGLACRGLKDHPRALAYFEQGRALAHAVGDAAHEASLLWQAGVEHAELGRRQPALARAQEAVALLRRLGQPQAEWYARHLARYRRGTRPEARAPGGGLGPEAPGAPLSGVIDAAPRAHAGKPPAGPGVLRMAITATKAMVQFVGSGFQLVPEATYRSRLAACAVCAQHTGLRCRVCGCVTAAKARLVHEVCPIGKWPS